mgnify:FL=1|jgi:hypothetical protein
MGILGEKLTKAINDRDNNVENFIWKGPKKEVNGTIIQEEIKLLDATKEQLQYAYDRCMTMLYNTDKITPGRVVLLDIIKDQRRKCNAELYLRWLENKYQTNIPNVRNPYPRFLYNTDIREVLDNNKEIISKEAYDTTPITALTDGIPMEFRDITIKDVLLGTVGALGLFDRSHISLSFITKMGVWFTDKEMNELLERDEEGKVINRIDVVKSRFNLRKDIKLFPNESGLSYNELRAMLNLKTKKYSELTSDQLLTLRDKVLFRFEDKVRYQISQWEDIIKKIEYVAELKNIELEAHKSN